MTDAMLVPDREEVDALPYIDSLYQGKMKADVDNLIRREMSTFESKDYLELLPTVSYTMQSLDPISTDHYSVCIYQSC